MFATMSYLGELPLLYEILARFFLPCVDAIYVKKAINKFLLYSANTYHKIETVARDFCFSFSTLENFINHRCRAPLVNRQYRWTSHYFWESPILFITIPIIDQSRWLGKLNFQSLMQESSLRRFFKKEKRHPGMTWHYSRDCIN